MIQTKHYSPAEIETILSSGRNLFFIGIGGISMSALALIAKEKGLSVSGSDRAESHITEKLVASGIDIHFGHKAENIKGSNVIIFTAAIKEDNPEVIAAKAANLPFIYRADFLNYIMCFSKKRIGVSGMHGKSTTSALISHTLLSAGLDPTILIGAELSDINGTYHIGNGDICVFEADEYSDSFLSFSPTAAVVLNIDIDHVDYFHSLEQIKHSFTAFLKKTEPDGIVIANYDCANVRSILPSIHSRVISYGLKSEDAMYQAKNIEYHHQTSAFDIYRDHRFIAHTYITLPGAHNVSDALGAFAAMDQMGVNTQAIIQGIQTYQSAKRRMELKGYINGAPIFEDYAHHPSEIKATLKGIRNLTNGRILCAFQPHTYSRTAGLLDGFIDALSFADIPILADIYAARETNTYHISSQDIAKKIKSAQYFDSFDKICDFIRKEATKDDLVVVMGAGDIYKVSEMLTEQK